jgi:hypothetical protein
MRKVMVLAAGLLGLAWPHAAAADADPAIAEGRAWLMQKAEQREADRRQQLDLQSRDQAVRRLQQDRDRLPPEDHRRAMERR